MKASEVLWTALGGALGAVLRALFADAWDSAFPWGIFFCNVTGAGLLAIAYGFRRRWHPGWWHFHGAGFCGGFTTVSTFSAQVLERVATDELGMAALYVSASLLAALPLVAAILWIEGRLRGKAVT